VRVCMMTSEIPPKSQGGVGHYVWELSRMLTQMGHEVTILTRGSWRGAEHRVLHGITIHATPYIPLYPVHAQLHSILARQFVSSGRPKFDILHVHLPLVGRVETSIPVVVTVHSLPELVRYPRSLSSLEEKLFSPFLLSTERTVVNKADIVTTVSEFVAEEVRKHLFFRNSQITVIGSGVDHDFFKPISPSVGNSYVLYVGRLHNKKGVLDLVHSASYVHRQYPDVHFILIGSGPLERKIRKTVQKGGLVNRFKFIRTADKATLRRYYSNASVFLLPSYYEGLPLSLLEAMSCGAPVVATSVGGIKEIIKHGQSGFLVRPGDLEALAQSVVYLISNPLLGRQLGENARKRIMDSFTWKKVVERLVTCYVAALSENREF